jgi:hypothetical protein
MKGAGVRRRRMPACSDPRSLRNLSELRWALADCELRKKHSRSHGDRLYRLEKRIRDALDEIESQPN